MYKDIVRFLEDQNYEIFDKEFLIWIDWRECDEDVLCYVNGRLEDSDKFNTLSVDNGKPYGADIILKNGSKELMIDYGERMQRDVTLKALGEFLSPKYEIRLFKPALGGDTLAFVLLKSEVWGELERKFDADRVRFFFASVLSQKAMFELDMQEIEWLLEFRARGVKSAKTERKFMEQKAILKDIECRKQSGEIDLKTYLKFKNQAKEELDKIYGTDETP